MPTKSNPPGKKLPIPQTATPPARINLNLTAEVVRALEDSRYDWRTMDGLVRSTGIPETAILTILGSMSDQIVRATTADSRTVFTTRNHYEKTHGLGDKLLSVLADKIVA
jgi:hypothetical protein